MAKPRLWLLTMSRILHWLVSVSQFQSFALLTY